MPKDKKNLKIFLLGVSFFIPLLYWIYLGVTSEMVVVFDSLTYERLGRLLAQDGWYPYFKTGPNQEPLYPFLISIAMRLGEIFSLSYQKILAGLQIALLLAAQILTLITLKRLRIGIIPTALVILYIGISPALVNSAFSLFSEIAAYPFMLAIVLVSAGAWEIFHGQRGKNFFGGLLLGLLFLCMVFLKAAFEVITLFYAIIFTGIFLLPLYKTNKRFFGNALVYLLTFLLTFYIPVSLYKLANKKLNGTFALTDRAAWAFYGNTARRAEALSPQRLWGALAMVPGHGICHLFLDESTCRFWSAETSDQFGYGKWDELKSQNLSAEKIDKLLMDSSFAKIKQNPLKHVLLSGIEALKMFFWESTQIGYVGYPGWLRRLFAFAPFKNGVRLIMSVLTIAAFIYALLYTYRRKKDLFSPDVATGSTPHILLAILMLVVPFIMTYSVFYILTRYALPLAPLYLILIGFMIQNLSSPTKP